MSLCEFTNAFRFLGAAVLLATLSVSALAQNADSSTVSATQTSSAAHPALDVNGLHPIFRLSPAQVQQAIQKGEELARKSAPDWEIYKSYQRRPRWVRKRGDAAEEYVLCLGMEGTHVTRSAFEAARKYEKLNIPDVWRTQGTYVSTIYFQVRLISAPKFDLTNNAVVANILEGIANISHPRDATANSILHSNDMELKVAANVKNVQAEKFVISDDRGNNYDAETIQSERESGDVTLQNEHTSFGVAAVLPHATVYQKVVIPYTQQHPYFEAKYYVRFPLFDETGKARISPEVRELKFRIITSNNEGVVSYKLAVPTSK